MMVDLVDREVVLMLKEMAVPMAAAVEEKKMIPQVVVVVVLLVVQELFGEMVDPILQRTLEMYKK